LSPSRPETKAQSGISACAWPSQLCPSEIVSSSSKSRSGRASLRICNDESYRIAHVAPNAACQRRSLLVAVGIEPPIRLTFQTSQGMGPKSQQCPLQSHQSLTPSAAWLRSNWKRRIGHAPCASAMKRRHERQFLWREVAVISALSLNKGPQSSLRRLKRQFSETLPGPLNSC